MTALGFGQTNIQASKTVVDMQVIPYKYAPSTGAAYVVVNAHVRGTSARLLVDTGSRYSFVDGSPVGHSESESDILTFVGKKQTVRIGSFQRDCVVNSAAWSKESRRMWDGLAGNELFAGQRESDGTRLTFDFVKRKLMIDWTKNRPKYVPRENSLTIPFKLSDQDHHILIRVRLGNASTQTCIFDTGTATGLLVSDKLYEKISHGSTYIFTRVALSIMGRQFHTDATALGVLPDAPPCIGVALFRHYRTVIDYRDRKIYLEPPSKH